jgi:type IV secretion system protein TrbD
MLRTIPIHRSANRSPLFMGGDREVVMFAGVIAVAVAASDWSVRSFIFAATFWSLVLWLARLAAKADPELRAKYQSSRRYNQPFYPARPTPFARPRHYGGGKPPRRFGQCW